MSMLDLGQGEGEVVSGEWLVTYVDEDSDGWVDGFGDHAEAAKWAAAIGGKVWRRVDPAAAHRIVWIHHYDDSAGVECSCGSMFESWDTKGLNAHLGLGDMPTP